MATTNFGLTASMISVLLGILPLYDYSLATGGPAVMFWSQIIVGVVSTVIVSVVGEISSSMPTMGCLYYFSYKLGGPRWGPFAAWITGYVNLLGQIAGVASGAWAGATVLTNIHYLMTGVQPVPRH